MKIPNKKIIIHFILAAATVAAGFTANNIIKKSGTQIEKHSLPPAVPLARTVVVEEKTFSALIDGHGTVYPLKEIQLVPQVGGKVVYISPEFVNGGKYNKGDLLLQIDPSDYEIAVTLAEALVKDAESKYILAEQESSVAKSDWNELHPGKTPPPLVAKEPQLATAKARLDAQKAELERARLNLARTRLEAPFDGIVGKKNIDIDQYISPGQGVAALYSTEAAEIVVPMESDNLQWFHVPGFTGGDENRAVAEISVDIAGKKRIWKGRVERAEGKVDEQTRMINIVIRVNKPYAGKPPLAPGLFVSVKIRGRVIEKGIIIPRAAIHQNNIVWVVNEKEKLEFRTVEVALRSIDGLVVTSGISDKERVVVSPIKEVTNGMKVRNVPAYSGEEKP